ncbi:MAG: F0F1 ATP synthase subunit delta [Bacteriovoracaceae bacterium]|nr:F0F1 ATP synthase subunit delta [Bacteriovoracaceae bacterium]
MRECKVRQVYAKALFNLIKLNKVDLLDEYKKVCDVIKENDNLRSFLFSRNFGVEEKIEVMTEIFKRLELSIIINHFICFLIKEYRIDEVLNIYDEIKELDIENMGVLNGVIYGAKEDIDPDVKHRFEVYMKIRTGRDVKLKYYKKDYVTAGYKAVAGGICLNMTLDNQLRLLKNL